MHILMGLGKLITEKNRLQQNLKLYETNWREV
jgi:hypothetical protein